VTTILLVDDETAIRQGVGALLADAGHRAVVCGDAESAEIVLDRENVDALVCDIRLTGPFRFEGLDLLDYARRAAPAATLIAVSGSTVDGLPEAARERGASFLAKPFEIGALEALLPAPDGRQGEAIEFPPLEALLSGELLAPSFQPIVRLGGGVEGYEALARLPRSPYPLDPGALFRYGSRKQQTVELNLTCIRRALEEGAERTAPALLFMNVDGSVFSQTDRLVDAIPAALASRIVLEITEQHPFHDTPEALVTIDRLRARGARFAFDDVGVAYSHLPLIGRIRPEYLKISQLFGTSFEIDETRTKLVQNVIGLARDFGATVILEGIESGATAEAAREMGIELGQGFWFG
jgi:EAL domain-containing protein (putative c-di-GMP-specific phosphodiesterase class I)/ActR/RegA family two-component response regulator